MARVRCVMMQRDESMLLEPWLRYYGYLFGFDNLTVFDNGSLRPDVLATLDRFEASGVTIYRGYAGQENFEGKGYHFGNIIRGWDHGGDYDFALPLDCDEFLAVLDRDGITCGRTAIHRLLDGLADEKRALGIEFSMFNAPGRTGTYHPRRYPKGFFARDTFEGLDRGFHEPVSRYGGSRDTGLTYLHYHNKPFAAARAFAAWKLAGRIDLSRPESWEGYTGSGNHLLPLMRMSEADYLHQFDDRVLLRYDGLENLLRLLGPLDPALFPERNGSAPSPEILGPATLVNEAGTGSWQRFDEATYYELNPDVAQNGIEGLKHYLRHGFEERRRIRRPEPPGPRPGARGAADGERSGRGRRRPAM